MSISIRISVSWLLSFDEVIMLRIQITLNFLESVWFNWNYIANSHVINERISSLTHTHRMNQSFDHLQGSEIIPDDLSNEIVSLIAFAVIKKDARSRDAKCEFDEATHDRMIFDTQYHNIIFFLSASNRSHCHWLGKLIHLIPSRCSKKKMKERNILYPIKRYTNLSAAEKCTIQTSKKKRNMSSLIIVAIVAHIICHICVRILGWRVMIFSNHASHALGFD